MRRERDLLTVLRRCSDEPHALLLLARLSPAMGALVTWLAHHVRGTERLEAYEWSPPGSLEESPRWYVDVSDPAIKPTQPCEFPVRSRLWFSVRTRPGEIIWNGEGGNCGTRDRRWHALFRKAWPYMKAGQDYHKYTFRP